MKKPFPEAVDDVVASVVDRATWLEDALAKAKQLDGFAKWADDLADHELRKMINNASEKFRQPQGALTTHERYLLSRKQQTNATEDRQAAAVAASKRRQEKVEPPPKQPPRPESG